MCAPERESAAGQQAAATPTSLHGRKWVGPPRRAVREEVAVTRRAREAEEVSIPRSSDAAAAARCAREAPTVCCAARAAAESGSQEPVRASTHEGAAAVRMRSDAKQKAAPKAATLTQTGQAEAARKDVVERVARTPCRWKARRGMRPPASSHGPLFSRATRPTAPQLQRLRRRLQPSLSHC